MPASFYSHINWVTNMAGSQPSYAHALRQLSQVVEPYGTPDTYARALYLQGGKQNELDDLKLHLSYFFMIEQLYSAKKQTSPPYEKHYAIDPRYMGWLALLLQQGSVMRDGVNVLSWNYDLQIQHALTKYTNVVQLQDVQAHGNWSCYPDFGTAGKISGRLPFLVQLNGMAGLVDYQGNQRLLADDLIDADVRKTLSRWFSIYNSRHAQQVPVHEQMRDTFTFAWENSRVALEARQHAKRLMEQTEVLVVIGYSFPLFNREVDRELVDAFIEPYRMLAAPEGEKHAKRVVIQNPSPNAVDDFIEIFEWNRPTAFPEVKHVTGTSSFHVPSEMF